MSTRHLAFAISAVALATASLSASADVLFSNLGTGAPPATIGGHMLTPFDQAQQAAIPQFSDVTVIPGGPNGTTIGLSTPSNKVSIGNGWATWSHGYTGVVYSTNGAQQITLTLPPGTSAFYAYVEPNPFAFHDITATTDTGATSGAVSVTGSAGANGFAFHSTAGESIATITITGAGVDFAFGEFGISGGITCASEGYAGTKLLWCQNICEKGYTGSTLAMWIRRWTDRYRDLPYCAANPPPPPPQND